MRTPYRRNDPLIFSRSRSVLTRAEPSQEAAAVNFSVAGVYSGGLNGWWRPWAIQSSALKWCSNSVLAVDLKASLSEQPYRLGLPLWFTLLNRAGWKNGAPLGWCIVRC